MSCAQSARKEVLRTVPDRGNLLADDSKGQLMHRFQGRVCVISGAGGGIGGAIAARFAREGAGVIVADVDEEAGERAADILESAGGQAAFVGCDVTQESDWDRVIRAADDRFGPIDVLVNAAGVFGAAPAPVGEMPFSEWRRVMGINLDGVFLGVQAAIRAMRDRGGAIVNVGSVAGYFGARSGAAYGVSKGGVAALTQQFAFGCLRDRVPVRVNAVHPGYVLTQPVLDKAIKNEGSEEKARAMLARRSPANRSIMPEEIAGLVAFLASDEARPINGANYIMDDGLSSYMPGMQFA
jgi:NAD(P)-dependent dehydrogenase (short-subunit alcohol dehydrogenase family)